MILDNKLPRNYQGEIIKINLPIIGAYGETEQEKELFLQTVNVLTDFQFIWLGYLDKSIEQANKYPNLFIAKKLDLLELSNLLIIFCQYSCQETIVLKAINLGLKVVAFSSVANIQGIIQEQGYLLHGKPDLELIVLLVNSFFSENHYQNQTSKNMNNLEETKLENQKQQELTNDSKNFMDYKNLGDKLSKEGKLTEAATAYQQAINLKPEGANLYYLLATVQEKLGELDRAIESYKKAIKLNPEDYWIYKLLGDIFTKKELYQEAEKLYIQAIKLNPDKPNIYYILAKVQEQQGKLEQAIENYQESITLNPKDYKTRKLLGDIFRQQGNFYKSETLYLQALEVKPDYGNLYYFLALVQKAQGKIEMAINSCHQGIKIAKNNKDIDEFWYQIGILEEHFGRTEEAYIAYIKSYCYQKKEERKNTIQSLSTQVAHKLTQLSPDDPDLGLIIIFFEAKINSNISLDEASSWLYQLLILVEQYPIDIWANSILGQKILTLLPGAIGRAEEYNHLDMAIKWLSLLVKYHTNLSKDIQTWLAINILWYQIKLKEFKKNKLLVFLENEVNYSQFNFNYYLDKFPIFDLEWLETREGITLSLELENSLSLIIEYFKLHLTNKISPHPIFDIQWYQSKYAENLSQNPYYHPLIDFLRRSAVQPEETNPSAYFDAAWYCDKYNLAEGETPLLHYLHNFQKDNISPHPFFDCNYFRQMLNLSENIEPLGFYLKLSLKYGTKSAKEVPIPTPLFHRQFYIENNPELLEYLEKTKEDAYHHFMTVGYQENRLAHPWQIYQEFVSYHKLHPLENLKTNINKTYLQHFNNLFLNLKGVKGNQAYLDCIRTLANQLTYQPLISIIMPVYQVKPQFLQDAIASVKAQTYENWQICIVDDASGHYRQEILTILRDETQKDSRIIYKLRKENGNICRTSNDCLALATGEYIAQLNPADILSPDALYEVVKALNENQDIDILYSDEDKIDEWGILSSPFYKPDWSPHSILARMYVGNLAIYKTSIIRQIEGFRIGFEGAQDYDILLRCSEIAKKIYHIPRVLYHQRIQHNLENNLSINAARKAVEEHLHRKNLTPKVTPITNSNYLLNTRISLSQNPTIDILIPSRDAAEILEVCLESIFLNTSYQNFKVTVIDNGSKTSVFKDLVNFWYEKEPQRFSVISCDIDFNYSLLNNIAVSQTEGEYLLLLNNDIEIISKDWLEALLEYAHLPEVGAVGARLLYPDRTIQHGGVIIGLGGLADHVCKSFPEDSPGYYGNLQSVTNYSAVTGACLMVSREKFLAVGGLNEHLKVAFNDVDFCLKLIEKGFYNVYIPHVEIIHHESKTRGIENTKTKKIRFESEILYMVNRWSKFIQHDPFYSPYLTLEKHDFSYRFH